MGKKSLDKKQAEAVQKELKIAYGKNFLFTFIVGLVAILVGLWIDKQNGTQPLFAIVLLVISVPIVVWLDVRSLRKKLKYTRDKFTEENSNSSEIPSGK